jgi:hypothetical protein
MRPGSAPCLGIDPGFEDEPEEECDHSENRVLVSDAGTFVTLHCLDCGAYLEEPTG